MKPFVYIVSCPPSWVKTPPLALVYLANYLRQHRVGVRVGDLNRRVFEEVGAAVGQWLRLDERFELGLFGTVCVQAPGVVQEVLDVAAMADVVGFSVTKRSYPFAQALAALLRQQYPDKRVVFGGPHVLFLDRQQALDDGFDWVVGEGEQAMKCIVCDGGSGVIRFDEVDDLDSLPFLDFSVVGGQRYWSSVPLLSSRGCPHGCAFCSERLLVRRFRCHSPEYMVDQIAFLIGQTGLRQFVFCDSLIDFCLEWLERFCLLVVERKLGIKWEAQIRVRRDFPVGLARLMKESGCFNLFIGLESGSDEVLRRMNKGVTTFDAAVFLQTLKAAGLHYEVSLIVGYPGETDQEFKETIDFIIKYKTVIPKIAQVNPFVDYLDTFSDQTFPTLCSCERVNKVLAVLEQEKIRFTRSFINNLLY